MSTHQTPADVTPPTHEILPLVTLAVEHVFDTLTRQPVFEPTVLAVTHEGRQGMWTLPELVPEQAAAAVADIQPTPERAVAVFDGEVQTPQGPRPAVVVEAFDAAAVTSTRLVFRYVPGVPGTDLTGRIEGEPILVANDHNPLFGQVRD